MQLTATYARLALAQNTSCTRGWLCDGEETGGEAGRAPRLALQPVKAGILCGDRNPDPRFSAAAWWAARRSGTEGEQQPGACQRAAFVCTAKMACDLLWLN